MRFKDTLYYGTAAVLFLATIPIYRYILRQPRVNEAHENVATYPLAPKSGTEPPPDLTLETCWTNRVRGACAYISEAEDALSNGKARCMGGLVMVVHKQGETTVIEEWPRRTQCHY